MRLLILCALLLSACAPRLAPDRPPVGRFAWVTPSLDRQMARWFTEGDCEYGSLHADGLASRLCGYRERTYEEQKCFDPERPTLNAAAEQCEKLRR